MRDRALSYGTEKSSVGQSSLVMLDQAVSFDTSVSCGTEQSHEGQSSLMWDRAVLCKTVESYGEQGGLE